MAWKGDSYVCELCGFGYLYRAVTTYLPPDNVNNHFSHRIRLVWLCVGGLLPPHVSGVVVDFRTSSKDF